MPFIPALATAGVTWGGIGAAVSAVGAVVGVAGTAYSMISGNAQAQAAANSQMPKLYTPQAIPMPQMPQMSNASLAMPEPPTLKQPVAPPIPSENIIRPDQTQLKRMGQVRSAFFTGDVPYKQYEGEKTGAMTSTKVEEEESAINQVLGG